jgi:hypothetical protein
MTRQKRLPIPDDGIRVCATQPPNYNVFVTWYKDGRVIRFEPGGETAILGEAETVEELNLLLYEEQIMPIGFGRRGKKRDSNNDEERSTTPG